MRTNTNHAKKVLLALFVMLTPLMASAEKVEIDGIWYNLVSKAKQATVTRSDGTSYSGNIIIPTTVTYDGVEYSVTSIGNYAFENCRNLTAIVIPKGIIEIGQYAFSGCGLHTITIPGSVNKINTSTFLKCSNLTSVYISEGVTSIGNMAFSNCSKLTSITIPSSMTEIKYAAFYNCKNLTAVHINSIKDWCKISFDKLTEGNGKPANPLSYAQNLYLNEELITELVIPEGVTSISDQAFYNCKSITSITIPESMTSIGNSAFWYCDNLTAVHIKNIKSWCKISFAEPTSNPIYYAHNLYLNNELITNLIIPEDVISIGDHAFRSCRSLTSIKIPEGVDSIGYYTFADCSSLISIKIPQSVTSIATSAFAYCSSLTSINIPPNVTEIKGFTFRDCKSLTSISIPESVKSIGREAFYGCDKLSFIVLSKGVNSIDLQAFANCTELLNIYCFAESVPSTDSKAFKNSYPEYTTLHVSTSAIESYKATTPWNSFGNIVSLGATITHINLSASSATLSEGKSLVLSINTTPEDADRNLISWSSSDPSVASVDNTGKVTAITQGTATITATAYDGSGVSASCEIIVQEKLLGKCEAPTISYIDGKVVLACATEGAKVITTVTDDNDNTFEALEFDYIPTQTFTAYATKEKYESSDPVSITICWIECTEEHQSGDTGDILTIPSKNVIIQSNSGVITLTGLADGTKVTVYTTGGIEVGTSTAENGIATIATNFVTGTTVLVKIAGHGIKFVIK